MTNGTLTLVDAHFEDAYIKSRPHVLGWAHETDMEEMSHFHVLG